jgi:putative FmdB family regulatory protein
MLVSHDFKCRQCGHRWEDIVERDEAESQKCPECGGIAFVIFGGGHNNKEERERYPYFDRGLGMILTSPAHRRQICKERGLTPVDGDYDIRRDLGVAEREAREEAEEREFQDYQDRVLHAPEFAAYRANRERLLAESRESILRKRGQR